MGRRRGGVSENRRRERPGPVPEWELGYGMTLDDVTHYLPGAQSPADSVVVARRSTARDVANGSTPVTSMRLHGTRLDVQGRPLGLLTLAMPTGGYRMVAVDGLTGGVRELWRASGITRAKASRRHYGAVRAVCAQHGASVVQVVGGTATPRQSPKFGDEEAFASAAWASLRMRLEYDGRDGDVLGLVARYALERLDSGDFGGAITELLDAARTDYAPLADAAGAWLRVLGYDQVHAHVPDGPDMAYASQLLHYDHELASR